MKSYPWIKLWLDILDDPKIGRLPTDGAKWFWIQLLLMAGESKERDGTLPHLDDIAWRLRENPSLLVEKMDHLLSAGIIKPTANGYTINNFADRQRPATATERKRQQRARQAGVTKRDARRDKKVTIREEEIREEEIRSATKSNTKVTKSILKIYQSVTNHHPGYGNEDIIKELFGFPFNENALEKASRLWRTRGYRRNNYQGLSEWYQAIKANPNWEPPGHNRFNGPDFSANGATAAWEALKAQAPGPSETFWARVTDTKTAAIVKRLSLKNTVRQMTRFNERQIKERFIGAWNEQ